MSFLRPKSAPPTPEPSKEETDKKIIEEADQSLASRERAAVAQRNYGVNQLRSGGTGLRIY